MNAMLDPRIVAASTHGLDWSAHGEPGVADRIIASSHGCLMIDPDAGGFGTIPDQRRLNSSIPVTMPFYDPSICSPQADF